MRPTPFIGLLALALISACSADKTPPTDANPTASTETPAMQTPATPASSTATPPPTDLVIKDLQSGQGKIATKGSTAVVNYTGWLYDPNTPDHKGTKFDSSLDRNEPFPFALGAGQVIQGWDHGVEGMKVGGKRQLIIPPDKAYGDSGAGDVIPPGSTLVFDVELLDVK